MNEYQILDVILNEPVRLPESTNRQVVSDEEYVERLREGAGEEQGVVAQGLVALMFQMLEKNP